ncbi:Zn(2+)-responsive transcriptional regulator [Vibrio sp. SCSIO 43135]|uniref:Zn(2+)-responsive transcriptional regulator n=1 Tax=Vibrio paucivorans TaxID=2829489 RepID=A0A9X3HRA1_9VIBR|nr:MULTISPECIES: Zn(2+)-responsive transcriptional regulator [Vibrio]MCW8333823.1 Zn(2+)-responsive transcriptional regulator [Vibrio paucivorans]USD40973.1 Zn(2+)-responsive transcriptional regulator [Vibrio sp. SCSIO 43135]
MFQIGELAKRCGVTADTLRFYEKNLLIQPAGRSDSGYRLYNEENQKQVSFILKAKDLGLSLDEIKELLEIKLEATEHSCSEVKSITSAKLALIDEKISELTRIRGALKKINDACCGADNDDASHCSILAALDDEA